MASVLCCPYCFGDRGLKDYIFPAMNPASGTCGFCGSTQVPLLEPPSLGMYFELLLEIYQEDDAGKTLAEWCQSDWRLFCHPNMDLAHAKELLAEVLDDGNIVRKRFVPATNYDDGDQRLGQWESLRRELMYENRWFLDNAIDLSRLRHLFDHLIVQSVPDQWFRARISKDGNEFAPDDMAAPPPELAAHGRANPAGIPYLYLGSTQQTSIAEVRPHVGEHICLAEFVLPDIKLVDLRSPRQTVSPFLLEDSTEIGHLRADLSLLEKLGEELERPVLPYTAAIDYIPSQYLCELIKNSEFDGVIYNSAASQGMNLALFSPSKARAQAVSMVTVDKVDVNVVESDPNP